MNNNMKKLLLILIPFSSQAQTCPSFQCAGHQVTVSGTMTNSNYNGNICFKGDGTVSNSVSVNNWQKMSWWGNINYQQTVNFSPNCKAWVQGNVSLPQVSFTSGDTLWNFGNLIITSYTSNNSTTNTIVNAQGATLKIAGVYCNTPQTLNLVPSNPSNVLMIASCSNNPLPLKIEYFTSEPLKWKFSQIQDIYKVELQWSENALDWLRKEEYYSIHGEEYSYPSSESGYYRLKIEDLDGSVNYSKVLRLNGKTYVPSIKYNLLGQIATEADRIYIQNHKLYYKHD